MGFMQRRAEQKAKKQADRELMARLRAAGTVPPPPTSKAKTRGRVKEYKRTCSRCQHVWYIPKKLADERAPNSLEMAGAKMQRAGANMSLVSFSRTRKQLQVQHLEEKRARVLDNSRCPSCGSTAFGQQRMW
jgi:ribosomal protein S27AE